MMLAVSSGLSRNFTAAPEMRRDGMVLYDCFLFGAGTREMKRIAGTLLSRLKASF